VRGSIYYKIDFLMLTCSAATGKCTSVSKCIQSKIITNYFHKITFNSTPYSQSNFPSSFPTKFCICACACICIHTHVHVGAHPPIHPNIHLRMCTRMHAHTHTHLKYTEILITAQLSVNNYSKV